MSAWGRVVVLSVGGALGVNVRYWLAVWIDAKLGKSYPWATFFINVSGAFTLGFLATLLGRYDAHHPLRLLALVGFLGGYTTFSTFAVESYTLWIGRRIDKSLLYLTSSVATGFLAVVLGVAIGRFFVGIPEIPRSTDPESMKTTPQAGDGELAEIA